VSKKKKKKEKKIYCGRIKKIIIIGVSLVNFVKLFEG